MLTAAAAELLPAAAAAVAHSAALFHDRMTSLAHTGDVTGLLHRSHSTVESRNPDGSASHLKDTHKHTVIIVGGYWLGCNGIGLQKHV